MEGIIIALDSKTEKTIARSGSASRVFIALSQHPRGLSIEEIAEICHLTPSTVYVKGLRPLFHAQIVESSGEGDYTTRLYRLRQEIVVHSGQSPRGRTR